MGTKNGIFYFRPPQGFPNSNSPQTSKSRYGTLTLDSLQKTLLLRTKNRPKLLPHRKRTVCEWVFSWSSKSTSVYVRIQNTEYDYIIIIVN